MIIILIIVAAPFLLFLRSLDCVPLLLLLLLFHCLVLVLMFHCESESADDVEMISQL